MTVGSSLGTNTERWECLWGELSLCLARDPLNSRPPQLRAGLMIGQGVELTIYQSNSFAQVHRNPRFGFSLDDLASYYTWSALQTSRVPTPYTAKLRRDETPANEHVRLYKKRSHTTAKPRKAAKAGSYFKTDRLPPP